MKEHHARALERGLAEFDRAVNRRRTVRRAAGFAAIALCIVAGAYFLLPSTTAPSAKSGMLASNRRPLPAYVEVIADDTRLALELEIANACERVGRRGGRVYIVECTASHEPGIDPLTQQ